MNSKVKGQVIVFEQVLLFSIGIIILITSLSLFMMYQNYYLSSTTQDQLTEVRDYVLSNIIGLCNNGGANSTVILPIPRRVGTSLYKISLSNSGINITTEPKSDINDFSTLYRLNQTFSFSGMVVSDLGKMVLYKNGNAITIDRR